MARKFQELFEKMPRASQRRARAMAEKELAEMELDELRKLFRLTQEQLAEKLKITQVAVSRLERRRDMHVSTLRRMIAAMGGELEIRVRFRGRTVKLSHLGEAR